MNKSSWLLRVNRLWLYALLFIPLLLLIILWSSLSTFLLFIALFPVVGMSFLSLAFLIATAKKKVPPSRAVVPSDGLPIIPRNLAQVYAMMNPTKFEYFSAAVVIGLGQGHRFHEHPGGAGDQGVDAMLHNLHGNRVIIQSKFYASDNHIAPTDIRDFIGALLLRKAVYGYFVTTSSFTKEAIKTARASKICIYAIDGRKLDALLRSRHREIALALGDILVDPSKGE